MSVSARLLRLLILLALFFSCLAPASDSSASTGASKKRILILFPFENNMPGFIAFDRGFREVLRTAHGPQLDIYIETMDLLRFPDAGYLDRLVELYRNKYGGLKMDIVIACLWPSLDFLIKYENELFQGTPILLVEYDLGKLQRIDALNPDIAVLRLPLEMESTLAMALDLHPQARNVFVVSGASRHDQSLEAAAREAFRVFEDRVNFFHLSGLPLDELLIRVSSLPEHSLVFFLSLQVDGTRNPLLIQDALPRISQQADAPVYGLAEPHLGLGIVGGLVVDFSAVGEQTAHAALRILSGEDPGDVMAAGTWEHECIFDARQMQRWGITKSQLPAGCSVRYEEFSLWESYRWQVLGVTAVVVVQAVLISLLLTNLRRRRLAEQALRQAELKYRTVADFTQDWEYWQGEGGRMIYISPACEQLSGYTPRQFTENPSLLTAIVFPEDREAWEAHVVEELSGTDSMEIQFRIVTREGKVRWIDHVCRPVTDTEGKLQGIRVSNRDITDRRRMQEEIQRAAAEWQATFDSITDLVMVLDEELRVIRANSSALGFFGLTPQDMFGQQCRDLLYGEDRAPRACPFLEAVETGEHAEAEIHRRNGGIWLLASVDPVVGEHGKILKLITVIKNITERKRSEEAVKDSEQMNRAILASLQNHIAILDKSGTILSVNEAWMDFARHKTCRPTVEIGPGVNYLEVCRQASGLPTDYANLALQGIQSVLDGKDDSFSMEYLCDTPLEPRWFLMKVMPFKSSEGGVVVSHTDISRRKDAELNAQRRQEELAHMTRLATTGELAALLAHEMNQPLTAILCNAEAAQRFIASDAPDMEEIRQILDDIVKDDKRAGAVIRRMRSLVKKETAHREEVDLNDIIRESLELIRNTPLMQGVSVTTRLEPELPHVNGDPIQLQQVILNLLLNAVAAMSEVPSAAKRLIIETTVEEGQAVRVSVRDSGPGIDENLIDRIFEPFYTTKAGGLGMGLAITRTILSAHGGSIGAGNNPEGEGAQFVFILPPG